MRLEFTGLLYLLQEKFSFKKKVNSLKIIKLPKQNLNKTIKNKKDLKQKI